jgi:hypothetical protein
MLDLISGGRHAPPQASKPYSLETDRALRWFLESGIQEPAGGVSRYLRVDTQQMRAVSTEITGYVAAALVLLHQLTGDSRALDAAVRAGRFLTRVAWNPALDIIPFELNPAAPPPAYFFDSGIIARGLCALWRSTGDAEFRDIAVACARSMAQDFRGPSGYHPVLALPGKQPLPGDGRWSREPGCYQLKAAMAWLETGAEEFTGLYEAALASFLPAHAAFLDAEPDPERVMDRLHAYCYFLEGLLPRALRPDCAAALRDGILRVRSLLDAIAPRFERSDVCAQLLRIRLYAAALGAAPLDAPAAENEAARILAFQYRDPAPRLNGAFCFGRRGSEWTAFANPVSTAFCVQALEMWRRYQNGEFRADPRDLI